MTTKRNAKVRGTIRRYMVFLRAGPDSNSAVVAGAFSSYGEADTYRKTFRYASYIQHRNLVCLDQQWHFVDDRPIPLVEGLYVKPPKPSIKMGDNGWYFVEADGIKPTMTLWLRLKIAFRILTNT